MSNISAVICELNPLHIGHKYIFDCARGHGEVVVAVMSGNFVQRGECAVFNKYKRAEAALMCGADLVLELPFPWSASPAEFFAKGALSVVSAVGADSLVFGSECGDTALLVKAAELAESVDFQRATEDEYTDSIGYAVAREAAAKKLCPEASAVFSTSNDMLALEYIRNAKECGFNGNFYAEKRIGGKGYFSASEIRKAVYSGEKDSILGAFPEEITEIFNDALSDIAYQSKLEDLEFVSFRQRQIAGGTFDCESGIVSRLEKCADTSRGGREMLESAATKKYTDARIRRAALFALCGITKEHLSNKPAFTTVLASNKKGRQVLSSLRKSADFEFVTKPSAKCEACGWDVQQKADSLYTLLCDPVKEAGYFKKQVPLIK